jgi:predicted  nucleic acid-binding Zn-ribbon protein
MNKVIDLDLATRDLKEAQDRFESLQAHVFKVGNEIALLEHIEKNLLENISVLKSRHIITVAVEYKRAKDDLSKIYSNMLMLKLNKNSLEHSTKQASKFLDECRERHANIMFSQGARVIEVDFGRKNDRQDGDPK